MLLYFSKEGANMEYNFDKEVKLFMIFDILGDTVRSGPLLWHIERKRLEDIKNHVLDLKLILRLLKKHFPDGIDYDKVDDYILCHDLPEAITGDITKFEGVSNDEINRVTNLAIDYLGKVFEDVMPLSEILNDYEKKVDLESKIVNMIDRVHSATTFIKYQSEKDVDMNDPRIMPELRNNPFVVEKINEGKDLADIFFEFHMKSVVFSDEECKMYGISRKEADKLVNVIGAFANEIYNKKKNGTLLNVKNDFPVDAMIYNRNK